jgi:hypothetical protein
MQSRIARTHLSVERPQQSASSTEVSIPSSSARNRSARSVRVRLVVSSLLQKPRSSGSDDPCAITCTMCARCCRADVTVRESRVRVNSISAMGISRRAVSDRIMLWANDIEMPKSASRPRSTRRTIEGFTDLFSGYRLTLRSMHDTAPNPMSSNHGRRSRSSDGSRSTPFDGHRHCRPAERRGHRCCIARRRDRPCCMGREQDRQELGRARARHDRPTNVRRQDEGWPTEEPALCPGGDPSHALSSGLRHAPTTTLPPPGSARRRRTARR